MEIEKRSQHETEDEERRLETENRELRAQLEQLRATELYLEARKKLLQFVAVSVVAISAFGVVSIKSITASIEDELRKNATHSIIDDVKDELVSSYSTEIDRQVSTQLSEAIASEIQMELLNLAKETLEEAGGETESDFAGTVVRSYSNRQFYVVVASSTDVAALRKLGRQYGEIAGPDPENPRLRPFLCESANNPNWGLAFGPPMALEATQRVIQNSEIVGIPRQSFPGRASRMQCVELSGVATQILVEDTQNPASATDGRSRR